MFPKHFRAPSVALLAAAPAAFAQTTPGVGIGGGTAQRLAVE